LGRLKPLPIREVKRRLEAAGFIEATQKGSHVKFVRRREETVDTSIVPKKSEVLAGTLRSIHKSGPHRPRRLGRAWLTNKGVSAFAAGAPFDVP
jgi:predicted RNA binding protein YcfA (HicA-like mRNA interferase family)